MKQINLEDKLKELKNTIIVLKGLFSATKGTNQKCINIEKKLQGINEELELILTFLINSESPLKDEYFKVLDSYNEIKNMIETEKMGIVETQTKENINSNNKSSKLETNDKKSQDAQKTYIGTDGQKVQIVMKSKEIDYDGKYNFTNLPIVLYEVVHIGQGIQIKNQIFSYPIDMKRVNNEETYRNNVINKLLTIENVNKAIEVYGGNVSNSLKIKDDSIKLWADNSIDLWTMELGRAQMRSADNFYRDDRTRICLLPVGKITLENGEETNQYLYRSFGQDVRDNKSGFIYGSFDLKRMSEDKEYLKVVLSELPHREIESTKYIGNINDSGKSICLDRNEEMYYKLKQLRILEENKDTREDRG